MSLLQLQDAIVALTALGAAVVVIRRLIGFAAPDTSPKCANCASSACAPAASPSPRGSASASASASPGVPAAHPLVFVRPSQH